MTATRGRRLRDALREVERRAQAGALALLGLVPEDRDRVVALMVDRRRDAVGYWLLLVISTGIATLGLALGSTAVVIGAMLIAPLMGPIVELGMALVIGSPALTLRALVRTLGSVAAVIGGAAALTVLLPFQEVTPEISSRTLPTALDLLIAVFVAFIAVLTTVRSSSETASAAAGTSIGIALVPPVCVIGYGLGIGDGGVAGGAALLFLTNLVAILFISVLCFLALGFEHVNAEASERAAILEARPGGFTMRALGGLERMFGSRYSRVFRVGTPALLIAVTYVPLSTALDQVAWEVRARAAVSRIVNQTLAGQRAVQSSTSVARRNIRVQLYLVGSPETAASVTESLKISIAAETGVIPTLDVIAVPDVEAIRSATAVASAPAVEPPPASRIPQIGSAVQEALLASWPESLGELFEWRLLVEEAASTPAVELSYFGVEPGPGTEALLSRLLADRLGIPVNVRARALPGEAVEERARGVEWLPRFLAAAQLAAGAPGLHACVSVPVGGSTAVRQQVARVVGIVQVEAERTERVEITEEGEVWSVRLRKGACSEPPQEEGASGEGAVDREPPGGRPGAGGSGAGQGDAGAPPPAAIR